MGGFFLAGSGLAARVDSGQAFAGGAAEQVALVVNADSWASLTIANEYVRLRGVPAVNVVCLSNLPSPEQLDVEQFRELVLLPTFRELERRGVAGHIDCVTYSSDIPYAIDTGADTKDLKLPPVFTRTAAVNGLTFLYRATLAKHPGYLQLDANRYARRPLSAVRMSPLPPEAQQRLDRAMQLVQGQKWDEASTLLYELIAANPRSAQLRLVLARCQVGQEQFEPAIASLQAACGAGWNADNLETDQSWVKLRDLPAFKTLAQQMKNRPVEWQPTNGFRAIRQYDISGAVVASGGERYLLSTMLAMTSGRGNSVSEALDYLRKAAAVDGKRPAGTIYFMKNGDVRSTTRHNLFEPVVERLGALGVKAEIIAGVLPPAKNDVLGVTIGSAGFDWKTSQSQLLPGSIGDNLTSFGGVLTERAGQTPLTEFLRYGAAGASGTVTEPYAIQAKFPFPMIHAHYAAGCTLAEAYYQSVTGPYQLLIVGDPLCRPFAKIPLVECDGIRAGDTLAANASGVTRRILLPRATSGDDKTTVAVSRFDLYVDGRLMGSCPGGESLELSAVGLAAGPHEARLVATVDDPIESQGGVSIPFTVTGPVTLTVETPPQPIRLDQTVRLNVKLPGARQIVVTHFDRQLGVVLGSEGVIEFAARLLGQGPVKLQALGVLNDERATRVGRDVELKIEPPAPIAAIRVKDFPKLSDGLLVRVGEQVTVVTETQDRQWLAKAGVKRGEDFEVRGYFSVPTNEVYQFQLNTALPVQLSVNDRPLSLSPLTADTPPTKSAVADGWQYIPVALQAGQHLLVIRGRGAENNDCLIRFGGPGAQTLDGKRFQRPE